MKVFTITEGLENLGALRTGGQGSVYKARRTGSILTAVKLIPTPIYNESAEDKNYRNFQNEVQKLKKVNEEPNPNVVKIISSGITESGSFPYIEMEYIEGPDLEDLLKPPHDAVFTIKEAIKLADQLACALSHCHKIGVRHGDIKSNNVKFNIQSGNYVLLDFGLAVMSDEQRRSSLRHAGAIEFMAPEQNEGQMLFQTDIYSYGVVLYELLAGQVPFPLGDGGETARNSVMLKHMEAPVPDLLLTRKQHLPDDWSEDTKAREMQVPGWLVSLISKCLQKNPTDRFENGVALQEAISRQSISGSTNAELQAENERLKQKITVLEETINRIPVPASKPARPEWPVEEEQLTSVEDIIKKPSLRLSRREIISSIIFMLLLVLIAVSAIVTSNHKQKRIADLADSLRIVTLKEKEAEQKAAQKVEPKAKVRPLSLAARTAIATKTTQQVIQESLKQDSVKTADAGKQKPAYTPKRKYHKKKKFLGLFRLP